MILEFIGLEAEKTTKPVAFIATHRTVKDFSYP